MTISIYLITNAVDSKTYIGKTKNSIHKRFLGHKSASRANSTTKLHASMRKHGLENFTISLIEETDDERGDERERFFIEQLTPDYNMTAGGEGHKGGKGIHGERSFVPSKCFHNGEVMKRIPIGSEIPEGFVLGMPPHIRDNMSKAHTGRIASDATKIKMSASSKWNFGYVNSEETLQKMTKAGRNKIISKETRQKMSDAKIGKKATAETKQKMSDAKIGIKKSNETRARMSAARKLRST